MNESEINGGVIAHISRRLFHCSMIIVPLVYYYFLIHFASQKILDLIILAFIFLVFLLEKFRIRMKLVLFGQRLHEATHISSFAWTMLGLGIILLLSPSVSFSIPIILTCAMVDPLLGELRSHKINKKIIVVIGVFTALFIWFVCAAIYHFPFWYGIIIAPITVAVEWPSLKWIDDNALMLIVPLITILFLQAIKI